MTGFRLEILVNRQTGTVFEQLLCCICKLLLRSAVQSVCGHRYCESCVKEKLSVSEGLVRCPACPADAPDGIWNEKEIYPDFHARKELKNLECKCRNEGCSWEGTFKQYDEDHEPVCDFAAVGCHRPGCRTRLRRGDLTHHLDRECSMRKVKCRKCGQEVVSVIMKKHRSNCPNANVKCTACGEMIPRGSVYNHWKTCITTILSRTRGDSPIDTPSKQAEELRKVEGKLKETAEEFEKMKIQNAKLETKYKITEGVVTILSKKVENAIGKIATLQQSQQCLQDTVERQQQRIQDHQEMMIDKDVQHAEQELRIQALETPACEGILVWKISGFCRRLRDAVSGRTTSFYSRAFYTRSDGYKMRARIHLNGYKMGKGTHVSLYFIVMKGRYDNILRWPFKQKVTFTMLNQEDGEDIIDSFRPDPLSSAFKKPTEDMNIASGCPCFIRLNCLENCDSAFVKDDCLFVKVCVDTSDLKE